jgi:hypothetical protein
MAKWIAAITGLNVNKCDVPLLLRTRPGRCSGLGSRSVPHFHAMPTFILLSASPGPACSSPQCLSAHCKMVVPSWVKHSFSRFEAISKASWLYRLPSSGSLVALIEES